MRVTTSYLLHPLHPPFLLFFCHPLPPTPILKSSRSIEHVFHPRRSAPNHLIRRRWMWSQMLLPSRRPTSPIFSAGNANLVAKGVQKVEEIVY